MDPFIENDLPNPGLTRIEIPTPFPVGPVNVYFIEGERPILVDTGLNSEKSYQALVAGLAEIDHAVTDIDLIILTHPHFDHFGLAHRLKEESGARLACCEGAHILIGDQQREWRKNETYFLEYFPALGVPKQILETIVAMSGPLRKFGQSVKVDRTFKEDDTFSTGRITLRAMHTPGHTPWCMTLLDRDDRFALSGDFLIKKISSNPTIQRPRTHLDDQYKPLVSFMASLKRFEKLSLPLVLSGHGEAINDHRELIARMRQHHKQRLEQIKRILADGPKTPFEISGELFVDLPQVQTILGISEVMAHLQLLEDDRIIAAEKKELIRYFLL